MKNILLITTTLIIVFFSFVSRASISQENIYLVQILNQLNAIQPLIMAAQKEQPINTRVQFHYTKYRDAQGKLHNGLLDDVNDIKDGIKEKLNQVSVEPRAEKSIKGDYLMLPSGDNQS